MHHLATIYETCATCSVGLDDPVVEFYTLITRMFERVQLLHHAATLGLNHVYYVEASAISIIRIVRAYNHDDVLTLYRLV